MMADAPRSYADPFYSSLASSVEGKLGLPAGLLQAIVTHGERSNADQVSSAGARTVFQIIPETRKSALDKYGIDAYLSPENAAEVAGRLLKDSLDRNKGDTESAVREYHGGTNRDNWGRVNDAYWRRVSTGLQIGQVKTLSSDFANWMKANPTQQAAKPAAPPAADDKLSSDFGAWLKAPSNQSLAAQIPGTDPAWLAGTTPAQNTPDPSLMDRAIGAGEAGLTALTGATGGALGMVGGTVGGLAGAILNGQFGTPEAAKMVEQAAAEGAQALTYSPRTQQGQEQAQAVGEAMQNLIPVAAVAPGLVPKPAGMPATAAPARVLAQAGAEGVARDIGGQPAAAGVAAAIDATTAGAQKAAKAVTTLPRRAMDAITRPEPTPGTMASAGAAGTDVAAQRQALAQSFPVPIPKLTKGQASRDAAQLKFEVETAKLPAEGAPLRQRVLDQQDAILRNFDVMLDKTGAEAPTLRAVGSVVDQALVKQAKRDMAEVNVAYTKAKRSPEAAAEVDQSMRVRIGEGDSAIESTPLAYINEHPANLPSTALVDAARQYAVTRGIADMQDGHLVPRPGATIRQMEDWRKDINQATTYDRTDIRHSTILKALIDGQTEPVAGPMYRQARALRARYAQNYEDHAVVAKLLNEKRGTSDRQVALEDVFSHSILKGSLDDVRNVRRVLQRSGAEGQRAWKELQGATVRHILDESTKSVALDSRGNRVLSPAALDRVIRDLDQDGKLDFIFGKQGAQQMRDLRELAQIAKTVPPEAAANISNTAMTLLAAFGDLSMSGMTGAPVPLITMTKITRQYIKDVKLRRRIEDALNDVERKAPGKKRPPVQEPATDMLH